MAGLYHKENGEWVERHFLYTRKDDSQHTVANLYKKVGGEWQDIWTGRGEVKVDLYSESSYNGFVEKWYDGNTDVLGDVKVRVTQTLPGGETRRIPALEEAIQSKMGTPRYVGVLPASQSDNVYAPFGGYDITPDTIGYEEILTDYGSYYTPVGTLTGRGAKYGKIRTLQTGVTDFTFTATIRAFRRDIIYSSASLKSPPTSSLGEEEAIPGTTQTLVFNGSAWGYLDDVSKIALENRTLYVPYTGDYSTFGPDYSTYGRFIDVGDIEGAEPFGSLKKAGSVAGSSSPLYNSEFNQKDISEYYRWSVKSTADWGHTGKPAVSTTLTLRNLSETQVNIFPVEGSLQLDNAWLGQQTIKFILTPIIYDEES